VTGSDHVPQATGLTATLKKEDQQAILLGLQQQNPGVDLSESARLNNTRFLRRVPTQIATNKVKIESLKAEKRALSSSSPDFETLRALSLKKEYPHADFSAGLKKLDKFFQSVDLDIAKLEEQITQWEKKKKDLEALAPVLEAARKVHAAGRERDMLVVEPEPTIPYATVMDDEKPVSYTYHVHDGNTIPVSSRKRKAADPLWQPPSQLLTVCLLVCLAVPAEAAGAPMDTSMYLAYSVAALFAVLAVVAVALFKLKKPADPLPPPPSPPRAPPPEDAVTVTISEKTKEAATDVIYNGDLVTLDTTKVLWSVITKEDFESEDTPIPDELWTGFLQSRVCRKTDLIEESTIEFLQDQLRDFIAEEEITPEEPNECEKCGWESRKYSTVHDPASDRYLCVPCQRGEPVFQSDQYTKQEFEDEIERKIPDDLWRGFCKHDDCVNSETHQAFFDALAQDLLSALDECDFCGEINPSVGLSGCDHPEHAHIRVCQHCDIDGSNYNGWCDSEDEKEPPAKHEYDCGCSYPDSQPSFLMANDETNEEAYICQKCYDSVATMDFKSWRNTLRDTRAITPNIWRQVGEDKFELSQKSNWNEDHPDFNPDFDPWSNHNEDVCEDGSEIFFCGNCNAPTQRDDHDCAPPHPPC
jgi:hypothetical protein